MSHYAVVNTATRAVENLVEYDAPPSKPPPGFGEKYIAVPLSGQYGDWTRWTWDGTNIVVPTLPPSNVRPALTFRQFMALFTPAEQAAIVNATDTQTKLFLVMSSGASMITLSDLEVVKALNYIATPTTATPSGPGLIAQSRVAQ